MTRLSAVLALLLYSAPVSAAGGIVITAKYSDGVADETREIRLEGSQLRLDYLGEIPKTAIFDGQKQVLWMIDVAASTYVEISTTDVDRLRREIERVIGKARSELNSLPEAQRAGVARALEAMGLTADFKVQRTVYKHSSDRRIRNWQCEVHEGFVATRKVTELCSVSPKSLGIEVAEFAVVQAFATFMSALSPFGAENQFLPGLLGPPGAEALSLNTESIVLGHRTSIEVTQVQHADFPRSAFTLPAGLTRQPIPNFAP